MSDQKETTSKYRDQRVLELYEQLQEIEERLIPTGLHVFGRPSAANERADMLQAIASFDRPEVEARALHDVVAEGLGISKRNLEIGEKETVAAIVRRAVRKFVESGPGAAILLLE